MLNMEIKRLDAWIKRLNSLIKPLDSKIKPQDSRIKPLDSSVERLNVEGKGIKWHPVVELRQGLLSHSRTCTPAHDRPATDFK